MGTKRPLLHHLGVGRSYPSLSLLLRGAIHPGQQTAQKPGILPEDLELQEGRPILHLLRHDYPYPLDSPVAVSIGYWPVDEEPGPLFVEDEYLTLSPLSGSFHIQEGVDPQSLCWRRGVLPALTRVVGALEHHSEDQARDYEDQE